MEILIGILVVIFIFVAGGTFLASKYKKGDSHADEIIAPPSDCCGAHEVCELDLQKKLSDEIEYFDDEELDRFKEKTPSNYSDEEIEEIRDVLYTLQPNDIKPWLESIEKRQICIPEILQQEARQLLSEAS